jgi:hypothetical protein
MKKIILTALISFCFSVYSFSILSNDTIFQDIRKPLRISGRKVYMEEIKLSKSEVLDLLSISPDISTKYKKGKNLKKTGTFLLIGGIVSTSGGLVFRETHDFDVDLDNTNYFIGEAIAIIGELMVVGGVVCKIVGKSNIKSSIRKYNTMIKTSSLNQGSFYYQLGLLDDGHVGFKVTF